MDSKICFEMSVFVVEAIRGLCASFMIVTVHNGLGDTWWTDKCTYFSSIDWGQGYRYVIDRHYVGYYVVPNSCAVRNNSVGWKIHPN